MQRSGCATRYGAPPMTTKKAKRVALSKEDKALFTAAKRKSAKALDAALEAGGSLAARDEQGFTALHLVAREHDLALALHLVARGADPWAGSYGTADGFRPIGFFGPDEAAQLAAAALERGLVSPETERLGVLATAPERGVIHFERQMAFLLSADGTALRKALRAGLPAASMWQPDAQLAPGKFRDPDDVQLRDLLDGGPTGFLVSPPLAERLTEQLGPRAVETFELLPVTLLDDAGAPREARFALHVLAVPALELERAFPKHNLINAAQIDDVAVHALRPEATELTLFRAAEYAAPVFIARALAAELAAFSGIHVRSLRR